MKGRKRRVEDEHAMGGIEAPTDIKCLAERAFATDFLAEYNMSTSFTIVEICSFLKILFWANRWLRYAYHVHEFLRGCILCKFIFHVTPRRSRS